MKKLFTSTCAMLLCASSFGVQSTKTAAALDSYHEVVLSTCYQFGDMDIRAASLEKTPNQCTETAPCYQYYLKLVFPYVAWEDVLILIGDATTTSTPIYEKEVTRQREVQGTVVSQNLPVDGFNADRDIPTLQKSVVGVWEAFQNQHGLEICKQTNPNPAPAPATGGSFFLK